ncbi:MAG: DsbA family protein [Nitrospirota bacterium]|nr:DsbA family protein [Nitrospirota bacterium]
MGTWKRTLCFAVYLSAVLFGSPVFSHDAPSPSDQQALIDHLAELSREIKALRQEIKELRSVVKDVATTDKPVPVKPLPAKVNVAFGEGAVLGDPTSGVGIIEFTDFQCPYCKRFHDHTFGKIKEQYIDTRKIQYQIRDFPLDFHDEALSAAVAARCANEQGQYWAMHHELFQHQRELGADVYPKLAAKLGLEESQFMACLNDSTRQNAVEADLAYGKTIGVRGTPNFYVGHIQNGQIMKSERISGAQPFKKFSQIIDALLE